MLQNRNTSQDPDYVGPVGHEKKFHKTHFHVVRKYWKSSNKPSDYEWVKISEGRWKRVKKSQEELTQRRKGAEVGNELRSTA